MEEILAVALVGALIVGPLAWRIWRDHRDEQALAVRARIHAALRERFHGEPMLSIDVTPPAPWRAGRVVLSAPADWGWVIEAAWDTVIPRVPADYELVVLPSKRPARRSRATSPIVKHA